MDRLLSKMVAPSSNNNNNNNNNDEESKDNNNKNDQMDQLMHVMQANNEAAAAVVDADPDTTQDKSNTHFQRNPMTLFALSFWAHSYPTTWHVDRKIQSNALLSWTTTMERTFPFLLDPSWSRFHGHCPSHRGRERCSHFIRNFPSFRSGVL